MPEFAFAVPIIIFIIVYNAVKKKKEQEAKAKQASLKQKIEQMEKAQGTEVPLPRASGAYPPRPVLPTKKPPQVVKRQPAKPVIVDIPVENAEPVFISPEGTELHEDKEMHGSPVILSKPPEKIESKPRYTAQELRNAFIMKEILDKPVSRR